MKILIVEDDENILSFLSRGLKEDNHTVESATNGEEGEYLATINQYDLIVLDWMLPSKSGIEILKTLRDKNISTPIIILTAKNEVDDRVLGLNYGADDYLSKPFSYVEFVARIEALYRRSVSGGANLIIFKDLSIDIRGPLKTSFRTSSFLFS